MVSSTVAVIAWAPSVVLCTPSPPVDARRRKNRDSASTLLLLHKEGVMAGNLPSVTDARGLKG
jgi:hypothetical protein